MTAEQNLPRWLIRALRTRFSIRDCVETGTLHGETAVCLAEYIPEVHTIEISRQMYDNAYPECIKNPRIRRHLGSSVEVIPGLLSQLQGPTLWYLDGHWSGFGKKLGKECPVVDEIALIRHRPNDVILIDDARLFIAPPGPPHDPAQWPTFNEVVEALRVPGRHIQLWIDTLVSSPYPIWQTL